jgi:hypothetical protein
MDVIDFFRVVFDPQPGERIVVLTDMPSGRVLDTPAWRERRSMAGRWRDAMARLGIQQSYQTLPLMRVPSGGNLRPLGQRGLVGDDEVDVETTIAQASLVLALTEYSADPIFDTWLEQYPQLRIADLPQITPAIEHALVEANYEMLIEGCHQLYQQAAEASWANLRFSNGDSLTIDLRFRQTYFNDGRLHRQSSERRITLPGGYVWRAAYEGEHADAMSQTSGVLPIRWLGDVIRLEIERNRVVDVLGRGDHADELRFWLATDPARCNLAGLTIGCSLVARALGMANQPNRHAPTVTLGRSDRLGGIVGPDSFSDPRHIWQYACTYRQGDPITVTRLTLVDQQRQVTPIDLP